MLARFSSPERKVERLSQATARTLASLAKRCTSAVINDPRAEHWQGPIHETRRRLLPGATRDDRPTFPGTGLTILDLWAGKDKAHGRYDVSTRLWGDTDARSHYLNVIVTSNNYSPASAGVAVNGAFISRFQPNNFIDIERPAGEAWARADAKVKRLELSAAAIVAVSVSACTGADFDKQLRRMTKLHNALSAFLGEEPIAEGVPLWQATIPDEAQPLLMPPVPSDAVA